MCVICAQETGTKGLEWGRELCQQRAFIIALLPSASEG